MKNILTALIVLLFINTVAYAEEIEMDIAEAKKLISENINNPNFVVLDIRTADEFNDGHIDNAINIDFFSNDFKAQLDKLDKKKKYLMYCRSGSRSARAIPVFNELGFETVYHMVDGYSQY